MKDRRRLVPAALRWLIIAASATLAVAGCGSRGEGDEHGGVSMPSAAAAGTHATGGHAGMGLVGEVADDAIGIDPTEYLTSWNFSNLPAEERSRYYKETRLDDGRLLREYWIHALDRDIEIAPGVHFAAWTYNGQVPGPTIRATEGDLLRIHFSNGTSHPHTMHFHGFHPADMDGSLPEHFVEPGGSFTYEFDADPVGLHLYHCHSTPLTAHIHRGLYGVFIVDPREPREPAQELVMMMNGFDTNFDGSNEVYAVNTVGFTYVQHPIQVTMGRLVRIYLVNILEFDETNSFHVHGNFFTEYRTGTSPLPDAYTDVIQMGQAERSILELRFRHPGPFMFHAHKTEFSELGWMGMFEVLSEEAAR